MNNRDSDLEAAIETVKKEIQVAGLQPSNANPPSKGNSTMATATKKTAAAKESKEAAPKAATVEGYTVADLAAEFPKLVNNGEADTVTLRKCLRDIGVEKPGTRWVWPKKTDPALVEARPKIKEWLATDGREGNGRKSEAAPAKKTTAAPAKKTTEKPEKAEPADASAAKKTTGPKRRPPAKRASE